MTNTKTVKTSEIHTGDVVCTWGMRVRIDTTRAIAEPDSTVYVHAGTVLNLDEVRTARTVPMGFLTAEKWVDGRGWVTARRDLWTVQGNDLARWQVETDAEISGVPCDLCEYLRRGGIVSDLPHCRANEQCSAAANDRRRCPCQA